MSASMIRASSTFLLVAALAVGACKKSDEGQPSPASGEAAKPVAPATPPPPVDEPAKPKVFEYATPQDLDADYRSVNGAAFMDKFGLDGRFRVSGALASVITEEAGNASAVFTLEGNKRITLGFADDGKALAAKGLKKGDTIKALCDAGGADDHLIMLIRCELE